MKRKKIISLIIIILIIITLLITFTTKNKPTITKVHDNICEVYAFTLTDNGTEIDISINNNTSQNINLNKINLELYDSNNKKIKVIKKNIDNKLKPNSKTAFKIKEQDKYPSTANVKCLLYKIN